MNWIVSLRIQKSEQLQDWGQIQAPGSCQGRTKWDPSFWDQEVVRPVQLSCQNFLKQTAKLLNKHTSSQVGGKRLKIYGENRCPSLREVSPICSWGKILPVGYVIMVLQSTFPWNKAQERGLEYQCFEIKRSVIDLNHQSCCWLYCSSDLMQLLVKTV